ncbi:hypothetical protein NSQ95_13030 [Psychrobacillus sp. FSL W7-1457]|uniref:hypothetical protein n=1 Tax=unclassified Psychrobacillus TaxID=2636677 RepID=UPI0030FA2A1F
MKKWLLLMLFCVTLGLSACSQGEEDTLKYLGVISEGKVLGYEYTVIKEQNNYLWKIGYKEDITIIEESTYNKEDLLKFRNAVIDSKLVLSKLIISVSYLLIVTITTFLLYKKNRKMLKDASAVITIFVGIAVYIAFKASFDLNSLLHDIKYFYLILTI